MADNANGEKDSSNSLPPPNAQEGSLEEAQRFNYFRNILMKCAEKCFAPARLEKISSCLHDIRKKDPEVFDNIIQHFVKGLQDNIKQELELMIKEENLVSLCHDLDQITAMSTETNPAWRPSGQPSTDIKDHVVHVKLEFREKLKEKLKLLQDENKAMQDGLMLKRKEVTDTEERIIQKQKELQKISEACHSITQGNNNSNDGLEKMIIDLQK